MFCQGSQLLLGFTWFSVLLQATVGIKCGPGYMVTRDKSKCEPCPENQYRPDEGEYVECSNCIHCKNSKQVQSCTPTRNAKCECWEGFSFLPGSNAECRCLKGSGIETLEHGEKICRNCLNGTFSNKINFKCQPWTKCDQNGVETPGNNTHDVVCRTTTTQETTPTSPAILISQTPANTSMMEPTRKATTRKSLVSTSTAPDSASPGTKQMQLQHWLVPLSCVLVLLLIQLAIIKLKVKTCFQKNNKRVIRQDSTCGKPVEESGEKFNPSAVCLLYQPPIYSENV